MLLILKILKKELKDENLFKFSEYSFQFQHMNTRVYNCILFIYNVTFFRTFSPACAKK